MTNEIKSKVVLPKEVADAIELMRSKGLSNHGIYRRSLIDPYHANAQPIHDWAFKEGGGTPDPLMQALVNGYEVERTPHDNLREFYEAYGVGACGETNYQGVIHGVRRTLNILGIAVEGINCEADDGCDGK